uniref:PDZ domain-containing protein n=1 Tax=Chromera velia CCMP2878 TaxID=1169474 RepID=A0A0G4HMK8_9ALVE|eukprot:Cvel_29156.t1-p1 / transcript=Cvel_29156.t1 / gene=Cvel_29156 / organism=Chromera_velia_CCMP2878 / gene_product=Carboxy-terminal-processing protease, putative / transcript_product=Carboxy-terminal-processing protease, putative / location=Cvel_scaffold3940:1648-11736(-) / protein_length=1092 / sequence_SO=supercontig / SO=protein_coding / is_pseudo=false
MAGLTTGCLVAALACFLPFFPATFAVSASRHRAHSQQLLWQGPWKPQRPKSGGDGKFTRVSRDKQGKEETKRSFTNRPRNPPPSPSSEKEERGFFLLPPFFKEKESPPAKKDVKESLPGPLDFLSTFGIPGLQAEPKVPTPAEEKNQTIFEQFQAKVEVFKEQYEKLFRPYELPIPLITERFNVTFPVNLDKTFTFIGGGIVGAVGILVLLFVPVASTPTNAFDNLDPITRDSALFETVLRSVDRGYVERVDTNKLFKSAVNGMLSSLDPYTEFEDSSALTELREGVSGSYGGVGIVIGPDRHSPLRLLSERDRLGLGLADASKAGKGGVKRSEKALGGAQGEGDLVMKEEGQGSGSEKEREGSFGFGKGSKEGANKGEKEKGVVVMGAFEGYAFRRGIRIGDHIVAIDGKPVVESNPTEVKALLRGPPSTSVRVAFARDGPPSSADGDLSALRMSEEARAASPLLKKLDSKIALYEVDLPRSAVQVPSMRLCQYLGKKSDGIGYIQLRTFSSTTAQELRRGLSWLVSHSDPETGGLQGVVLDLRNNPGGLLSAAVEVSSLFLPEGSDIVSAKGRAFPAVTYKSEIEPVLPDGCRLVILVNEATASAAEIVAGAVQDQDRGVVVGTQKGSTFGKGLVQNVEALPFSTALKYTVAKYYTPSGRCIQSVRYDKAPVMPPEVTATTPLSTNPPPPAAAPDPGDPGGTPESSAPPEGHTQAPAPPPPRLIPGEPVSLAPSSSPTTDSPSLLLSQSKDDSAGPGLNRQDRREEDQTNEEDEDEDGDFSSRPNSAARIPESQRRTFLTRNGRPVRDGGGIESDVRVDTGTASPLEVTLVVQNAFFDFATEWSTTNVFDAKTVDSKADSILEEFKQWVASETKKGNLKFDLLYKRQLNKFGTLLKDLNPADTEFESSVSSLLDSLSKKVSEEFTKDFDIHRQALREAVMDSLRARHLPEGIRLSMLLKNDKMVTEALSLAKGDVGASGSSYASLLLAPTGVKGAAGGGTLASSGGEQRGLGVEGQGSGGFGQGVLQPGKEGGIGKVSLELPRQREDGVKSGDAEGTRRSLQRRKWGSMKLGDLDPSLVLSRLPEASKWR